MKQYTVSQCVKFTLYRLFIVNSINKVFKLKLIGRFVGIPGTFILDIYYRKPLEI